MKLRLQLLLLFSFLIGTLIYGQNGWSFVPNYSFEKIYIKKIKEGDIEAHTPDEEINVIEDSSKISNDNIKHEVSVELLGPSFLSSIGYSFAKSIKKSLSIQFDFRIAGFVGYFYSGWSIGPSLRQSILLFGSNPRLKLGLSEGIVFNPASIQGKFDDRQPWDRPPRIMYYFTVDVGCEINIMKNLYLTPEINFGHLSRLGYTIDENFNQIDITRRGFLISFGIDLKFKL